MQRPKRPFQSIYQRDVQNDCYMIEIALDHYSDIFYEWDPAPFKRRDIDPDLKKYLEECVAEIPFRYGIEVCFHLPSSQHHPHAEKEARQGLETGLIFQLYLIQKQLKDVWRRVFYLLVVGFIFLWVAVDNENISGTLPMVLVHGLFVIGWVYLWEAISLVIFTTPEIWHRYRLYKRLKNAPILFTLQN